MGPDTLPAAIKPNRLIVLETEGWPDVDAATKAGFAQLLDQLEAAGVTPDPPRRPSVRRGAREGDRQRPRGLQRHHELGEPLVPARHARRRARRHQRARQGDARSRPRR